MWTAPRTSTPGSGGGWTPISRSTTASGSSSSPRPARELGAVRARITTAQPGSAQGLYLVVSDIQAARDELVARGAEVSEVFHPGAPGAQFEAAAGERVGGPADERASYSSFATFHDPDGNTWLLQEVTTRLPGRTDPAETTFAGVADLAAALRRAAAAHGEHEKRTGEADANWPDWYAAYMVAEQAGTELPT
jgi:predicted enzyme related to lactoylglutathione lyase